MCNIGCIIFLHPYLSVYYWFMIYYITFESYELSITIGRLQVKMNHTRYLVLSAIIAALYFALTMISYPIAFLPIQLRLSEALMLVTPLVPAAIPGVTLGCFLSNFINPGNLGPVDYIGGTIATLIAAILTQRIKPSIDGKKSLWKQKAFYLLPLPSVLINGAIVGVYLPFLITAPETPTFTYVLTCILTFSLSEALVVYLFGLPLYAALHKQRFIQTISTKWKDLA